MSRIWAVARHMIAEGIRMKIALVFIAIILIILPAMPFAVDGDGVTLKSRVQSFLSYSLGSVGFLLSLLTVFLSCASLCNEIRNKQIFMIASKPIPRWHFFVGKWLGISVLNAALLLLTGVAVWGFTWYLKGQPTDVPGDREALQHEVLNVRYALGLKEPDFSRQVEDRLRRLREEGRLENISYAGREELRAQIREEMKTSWLSLAPRQVKEFTFKRLLVDREKEGFLHLRFKPTSLFQIDDTQIKLGWQCGDLNEIETLTTPQLQDFLIKRFHSVEVPLRAVNSKGDLVVRVQNLNPKLTVMFEGDDAFEVLYDIGTFHWNLFRALCIIWCRLAFLAVVGLLASTFLSFPVACMVCFMVLLMASSAGFLYEAVDTMGFGVGPLTVVEPFLAPVGKAFLWLVPDFSQYDPAGTVVAGRVVPLLWVLRSLATLLFIKGLILGILGCVILTKRELAQVVV